MKGGMPFCFEVPKEIPSLGGAKKLKKDGWGSDFQPISPNEEEEEEEEPLLQWAIGDFQEIPMEKLLQREGSLVLPSSFPNPISFPNPKTLLFDSNHLDKPNNPFSPIWVPNGLFRDQPNHKNHTFVPIPSYIQQDEDPLCVNQLGQAAKLVQTGNLVQAQGILARLNHQLSSSEKPIQRAAYLLKEALQSLIKTFPFPRTSSLVDVIHKIHAFKSFSEVSPLVQFMNFTCNQSILEAVDGYNHIHVIDFDIGFGAQWASFIKEIATRTNGVASFKITAIVSQSLHTTLEVVLTQANLYQYANDLGVPFEFNIVSFESLESLASYVSASEAVAVNFPIGSYSSFRSSGFSVLSLLKQISPKIVVSVDQEFDSGEIPFSHILQSYSALLESLDAVKVDIDTKYKIEKLILQPRIERMLVGDQCCPTKRPDWRNLFTSLGFSPLPFSDFSETQADFLLRRLPVRGFHVAKCKVSLKLCWQRQELVSVSAWKC